MARTLLLLLMLTGIASGGSGGDFDRLKTLVGDWEATSSYGKTPVKFELTSNGTALVETVGTGAETMVTVYHADGDATMMTHYCSVGNQPRMRARKSGDGTALSFLLLDTANLKDAATGHMSRLVIKFQDADNIIEEWTWKEKSEEKVTSFALRRVKK
jgi:hypothetical protein